MCKRTIDQLFVTILSNKKRERKGLEADLAEEKEGRLWTY